MPTPEELRSFVARYCDIVSKRDGDAYIALFAEDAVQTDPANSPPNVGREAIRAFFDRSVGASQETVFEALSSHTCGDEVAVNFRVAVTLETGRMTIGGVEVFSLDDECHIRSTIAYWDDNDITFG